jgi:hypothetical protein
MRRQRLGFWSGSEGRGFKGGALVRGEVRPRDGADCRTGGDGEGGK